MNILFLTPQLPYPPHQGTTIRNFSFIRYLAEHHTIDLISFTTPNEALTARNPLHQYCRQIATVPQPVRALRRRAIDTIRSPRPDMALRLESASMHALVAEWVRTNQYDIVQVEGIEMAQYGLQVIASISGNAKPALVFDDHNCEYLLQKRNAQTDLRQPRRWVAAAYSLIQWCKLRSYEAYICRAANEVVAVSHTDQHVLQRLVPNTSITVVHNGIDTAQYHATDAAQQNVIQQDDIEQDNDARQPVQNSLTHHVDAAPRDTAPKEALLVFTGKMDYRPNIDAMLWFGRDVFPRVQMQMSNVRLLIVGMNPHPRLDELRENPYIELTGAVDDTRPYIRAADVYIIPMRVGGGTRFKVLEAMASGKAIVSTSLGVEGIQVECGRELLLADTPQAFAQAILRLLPSWASKSRDTGDTIANEAVLLGNRLGENARGFVAANYEWRQIIPILERLYERLVSPSTT